MKTLTRRHPPRIDHHAAPRKLVKSVLRQAVVFVESEIESFIDCNTAGVRGDLATMRPNDRAYMWQLTKLRRGLLYALVLVR